MFLRVLAAALIILAIAIFGPALFVEQKPPHDLPWQVQRTDGSINVFGITLGKTSLREAQRRFAESVEVSLFRTPADRLAVEGYFDRIDLSGLGASVVVTMALSRDTMEQMFERGSRISTMGSGTRKVTLSAQDLQRVMDAPIATLTYLPRVNLTAEQVRSRFGEPARKVKDPASGAVHWLYPQIGLDVALSDKEKEILQYVPPSRFGSVEKPLLERPAR